MDSEGRDSHPSETTGEQHAIPFKPFKPFRSHTTSVRHMIKTPELSIFYEHFHHWDDAIRNTDEYLNWSVHHFMRGNIYEGLLHLGRVFRYVLRFSMSDEEPRYAHIVVSYNSSVPIMQLTLAPRLIIVSGD